MRLILRGLIKLSILAVGLGMVVLTLFAPRFGYDVNNNWGLGRRLVAIAASCTLLLAFFLQFGPSLAVFTRRWLASPFYRATQSRIDHLRALWHQSWMQSTLRGRILPVTHVLRRGAASLTRLPLLGAILRNKYWRAVLASAALVAGILVFYVWIVSVGKWTDWPATTSHYDALAQAFAKRRVSLLIDPDPRLLALPDPYDFNSRQYLPAPWDVSLYRGHFYLYWGPVPALIPLITRLFTSASIGDQYLVFLFTAGCLMASSALIFLLWRKLFRRSPGWTLLLAILTAGLANPLPWILNRPAVYEAALMGGQFFWMAGVLVAFWAATDLMPSRWKSFFVGVCWILAIGCRTTLAVPIFFAAGMLSLWNLKRSGDPLKQLRTWIPILCMVIPIGIGLAALGWYNYMRFGSVFEFGHRYQLTGMNLHAIYPQVISLANVLPNLQNYLVNAFRTLPVFPYIKPELGNRFMLFPLHIPTNYYAEQVAGLLVTTPFAWFSVIPVLSALVQGWRTLNRSETVNEVTSPFPTPFYRWTAVVLLGAALLAFIPILLFIVTTMRYLADCIPILMVLSAFGFWHGGRVLANRRWALALYQLVGACLGAITVILSLLLAITSYAARFEHLNPALFDLLTRFFTR